MKVRDSKGNEVLPDWSCYEGAGSFAHSFVADASDDAALDAGPPPPVGDYLLHLVDLESFLPPVGANVDIFFGSSTQGDASASGVINDAGLISYSPSPYLLSLSYHVAASTTQFGVHWHDAIVVPPGTNAGPSEGNGQIEGNSLSLATQAALISSVFGSLGPQANLAFLMAAARDCSGNDVQGAQLRLIDEATQQDVLTGTNGTGAQPRAFYFVNDVPNSNSTWTDNNQSAIWGMANAPINEPGSTHQYTLQMFGRKTDSDPGSVVSSTPCELFPGEISVQRPYQVTLSTAPNRDGGT